MASRQNPWAGSGRFFFRRVVGQNDGDQKIAPVAVAAVVTSRAHQLNRNARVNSLHDGLVQAMQVIGNHADHGLLVGVHGGSLFFSAFLDSGLRGHGISPLVIGVLDRFRYRLSQGGSVF